MKRISLSVVDFALPSPRSGSIDAYSGFAPATPLGIELHQKIQRKRAETLGDQYQSEVSIEHLFEAGGYEFLVGGRIDGVIANKKVTIEEIKTSFNIFELRRALREMDSDHPYALQLRTYGYFYFLKFGKIPELILHLVSSRDEESSDWIVNFSQPHYEEWCQRRLAELVDEARRAEKRTKRRERAGQTLAFPFEQPRAQQVELIETIERGMAKRELMFIQAPTGLGKTMGVLYPTAKQALSRGQSVLYVTPKNSQHLVAEDAIDKLQERGANIKSLTLTAKSKMCLKSEPICNPDFCEYAKDYYTKVAENHLIEELHRKKKLTARVFNKMAKDFEVCPFELQIDSAIEADVIICDYNYVFAPRSALSRVKGISIDQQGKPNLVVDEAHNLPSRAMDYYSPTLSTDFLESLSKSLTQIAAEFRGEMEGLIRQAMSIIKNVGPENCTKPCTITPPTDDFLAHDEKLKTFLSVYLKSKVEILPRDPVLRLAFYWSEFSAALEFVATSRQEFFTTFHPHPPMIKITCCDPSKMLESCFDHFENVVGFSATLKPFEYYSRLSGIHQKSHATAEFKSPFPKGNRKLLVIPQISSKFSDRARSAPRIAEAIHKITNIRRGNYFAFFPSFEFMDRVASLLAPTTTFEIIRQERSMRREQVNDVLERLRTSSLDHIVFAVQGGLFAEGVDYPGRMAIGAFIVGPPLPNFDLERETMREYYEKIYAAGFDYAYTYPAMAKAIQAAGRVIRSENDKGIIVLMDDRFLQNAFAKSMPTDWFEDSPRELISDRILQDVSDFWHNETSQ
jgi:DNA excision repair protein ERCC-2